MKIVTLEDRLSSDNGGILSVMQRPIGAAVPAQTRRTQVVPLPQPPSPIGPLTTSVMPSPSNTAPIVALVPRRSGDCGCGGRCTRCSGGGWDSSQLPAINVNVSPTITANGGSVGTALSSPATGVMPPQVVEKPVFIDRVREVINEIAKPVYVPVREVVEKIKQMPLFMPFRTIKPVDRPIPMPLTVQKPVNRDVPVPVRYNQPVERIVPVPVNESRPVRAPRPTQPFQVLTNKKNTETGINYFS